MPKFMQFSFTSLMLRVMLSFTAYTSTKALISSSYANCFKKLKSLLCNLKWDPDALIISRGKKKALSGNCFSVLHGMHPS